MVTSGVQLDVARRRRLARLSKGGEPTTELTSSRSNTTNGDATASDLYARRHEMLAVARRRLPAVTIVANVKVRDGLLQLTGG